MEWTRSETVALATSKCVFCQGLGLKPGKGRRRFVPCKCVFREIFRLCWRKFRACVRRAKHLCHVTGEIYGSGGQRRLVWGRKIEEYIGDFTLMARRTLTAEEWRVFYVHYILDAPWMICCAKLRVSKGYFFRVVYRIQEKLGRAFREVTPYALYPLDEYFSSIIRLPRPEKSVWDKHWERRAARLHEPSRKVTPIRPPLRRPEPAPVIPFPAPPPEREPEDNRPSGPMLLPRAA